MSALPATQDDRLIWDTWLAQYRLPIVTAADEAGTFAALAARAMTTQELAAHLDVNARALGIHLALLAATGFVERRDQRWRATAQTRTWLVPEAEGYCGPLLHGYRQSQPLHAQLLATLRTGDKAEGHASAAEEWERGEMSADLAQRITAYMNAHSRAASKAVAAQPLFADVKSLLDVGGGSGIFSIELAHSWPALSATVMEIQAVCDAAQPYVTAASLASTTQSRKAFRTKLPSLTFACRPDGMASKSHPNFGSPTPTCRL